MGVLARWLGSTTAVVAGLFGGLVATAPHAAASFPGTNGRIAFVSERDGNFEIYSATDTGDGQRNLSQNAAADYTPAWSPDGTTIAFASERDGDAEIFVMNADGSGQTQLTFNDVFDADPAWSPDGTQLVVVRFDGTGPDQLVVIDTVGGPARHLTEGFEPMWSPDGTRIAFDRRAGGGFIDLFTIKPDGTGLARLTRDQGFDGSANWSPDSRRIAFSSSRSGNGDIYVMDRQGGSVTRVTRDPLPDILPAWSPEGDRISFTRVQDDAFTQMEVFTVRPDGLSLRRLTGSPGQDLDSDWGVAPQ